MAAPAIVPIIKKVASVVLSDKKGRKAVLMIIGIVLVIIILPIIALLGIFSGGIDLGLDDINSMVQEQQQVGEATLVAIEEAMLDEGYSQLRVEEAQAVYLLALFDKSDEENFVERLVGCFEEEQTDAELIASVNAEFGTAITPSEFTEALKEVREKYLNQEENSSG
jgi:hypothetical protein